MPSPPNVLVRPHHKIKNLFKLRKAVNGLVDAQLHWHQAVHRSLISLGALSRPFDPAIYLFRDGSALQRWAVVHVDDISIAGISFLDSVLRVLCETFVTWL